jgi:nucleoside-diphosphate-sugar epimerase
MKVLVTGHLGFVGVGIVKVLLEHGHQVVGFDRLVPAANTDHPNFQQVKGDITDLESIQSAIKGCDAVVHAAIGTRVAVKDAGEYNFNDQSLDYSNLLPFRINVSGTFNLFEVARQAGISQVVNISSAAVVFHQLIDRDDNHVHSYQLTAGTPPNYRGYYGMNKYLQEQIGEYFAREYHQSVITLRPWWVVDGPAYQNRMGIDLTRDVHPLTPAGLVCRYDLGELIHLALQHAEIEYDIFYPVAGPNCERYFDVAHLQSSLGWKPRYSFLELAQTWRGAQAA